MIDVSTVTEMIRLHDEEGLTYVAIGERLGISHRIVRYRVKKACTDTLAQVDDDVPLPLKTLSGNMWCRGIRPPNVSGRDEQHDVCRYCAMEPHCKDAVKRHDFIACERPLVIEMART